MANYQNAFGMIYQGQPGQPGQPIPGRYDINIRPGSSKTIPANLIVDSSRRNRSIYENPGHYCFDLISPYRDVISIEITQVNIPKSFYSVSSDNNKITFTFDSTTIVGARNPVTYTAYLPVGNYTNFDDLREDFETAINDAVGYDPGANQFTVAYSDITGRFTVTAPESTPDEANVLAHNNIVFIAGVAGGADTIIGLNTTNLDGDTVTFPNNATLNPYRYLVLEIRGMERCDGNSSTLMNSFCIIPVNGNSTNLGSEVIDNDTYIYYFPEPLPKMDRMEITIRKPDGNICDFNGRDHFLVFEVYSLTRPHRLND